jgi:hypothetical protein
LPQKKKTTNFQATNDDFFSGGRGVVVCYGEQFELFRPFSFVCVCVQSLETLCHLSSLMRCKCEDESSFKWMMGEIG